LFVGQQRAKVLSMLLQVSPSSQSRLAFLLSQRSPTPWLPQAETTSKSHAAGSKRANTFMGTVC